MLNISKLEIELQWSRHCHVGCAAFVKLDHIICAMASSGMSFTKYNKTSISGTEVVLDLEWVSSITMNIRSNDKIRVLESLFELHRVFALEGFTVFHKLIINCCLILFVILKTILN